MKTIEFTILSIPVISLFLLSLVKETTTPRHVFSSISLKLFGNTLAYTKTILNR